MRQLVASAISSFVALGAAAAQEVDPSTADLDFLIGEWKVERVYRPGGENERRMKARLSCERAVLEAFIHCIYDLDRPNAGPAREEVYFNYNAIYGVYENVWLSSTWPIKVVMSGSLEPESGTLSLEAQFEIERGRTEFVRSRHTWRDDEISYRVDIRTSDDEPGAWIYHMEETARRIHD